MSTIFDRVDARLARALTPSRRLALQRPRTLVLGFLGLHTVFLFALLPTILTGGVLGDLPLYRTWAELGLEHGDWQGIDTEWVYPIGAMLPIAFAGIAGPLLYQLLWFLLTAALNAIAVGALTDWGRRRSGFKSAWYWLFASFLLSPVGLLRLEGITAPLVIVSLVLLAKRPIVAAAALTLATWIKVWPAAVVLAVVTVSPRRRTVVLTGAILSAGVAASVWLLGGLQFLTGFVTEQSDRALQLEAPITTPWVWLATLGHHSTVIYENFTIATREVTGPGTGLVASLMTPVMFGAIAAIFVLMLIAQHRRTDAAQLLLVGALALVSAFIVFNKVGSPQYMLWLVPVVAVGVATSWAQWRVPAVLMLAISALTTLIFPIFYLPLIDGDLFSLLLLTARNALLVVLFGWSVTRLVRLAWAAPGREILARRTLPVGQGRIDG
ncbi:glycosyltransferase 87 family protein [Cryobacterium sp. PH31-L1]|uniref:glycosyltransferase 87 family protein n=1 Tax=Cryobacterium sp. PH31-L1 TaxID=3046199 RepID=UPI0024BB82BD|nr:glycosyltransferase 87 family protein [Cryobacterium sp. PH31-L1]MDJ0377354.1 glycosyltransferase 87 family protein [Cryobacterium sp. PH31-L1]